MKFTIVFLSLLASSLFPLGAHAWNPLSGLFKSDISAEAVYPHHPFPRGGRIEITAHKDFERLVVQSINDLECGYTNHRIFQDIPTGFVMKVNPRANTGDPCSYEKIIINDQDGKEYVFNFDIPTITDEDLKKQGLYRGKEDLIMTAYNEGSPNIPSSTTPTLSIKSVTDFTVFKIASINRHHCTVPSFPGIFHLNAGEEVYLDARDHNGEFCKFKEVEIIFNDKNTFTFELN